jgi:hypothetical protein
VIGDVYFLEKHYLKISFLLSKIIPNRQKPGDLGRLIVKIPMKKIKFA